MKVLLGILKFIVEVIPSLVVLLETTKKDKKKKEDNNVPSPSEVDSRNNNTDS